MNRAKAEARYREWLADHAKARFGFAEEIARLANNTTAGVRNSTPPVDLWDAIVPTLRLLERLREQFGPTTITSAYRDRLYNTAVGSGIGSQHIRNTALDFHCRTGTPADWMRALREWRAAGEFAGGVGLYVGRGFVHVDTRGTNADWTG